MSDSAARVHTPAAAVRQGKASVYDDKKQFKEER